MQHLSHEPFACPTFNSYSTDQLAEIARNVADDFKRQIHHDDEGFEFHKLLEKLDQNIPLLPVFDQLNDDELPLKNLCIEERETVSSSSDSDDDVPPESFCIWMPKFGNSSSSAPASCGKSKSTGSASSRRFRIRDLLRRSNSEDSFVILAPKNNNINNNNNKNMKVVGKQRSGEVGEIDTGKSRKAATGHEKLYVGNRWVKEGEKRKSYLPYRKDIVGFFG